MPERSSISQVVQIGVETTEGTAVGATKLLQALAIEPSLTAQTADFRPMGNKYRTLIIPGKEWVEANLTGEAVFDEIQYPLASLVGASVDSVTGTTGQQHVFTPSSTSEDAAKSFTVEQGSNVRAHRFSGGVVSEFGMEFTRDSVALSGKMIGTGFTDGITLTPSPTTVPLVPMLPAQVNVYLDPTSAALGTTKFLRALQTGFSLTNKYGPLWTLNSAVAGYAARVETEPKAEGHLMVEADAAGMGLLSVLRAGATRFLRIEVLSTQIIGAGPAVYSANFDFAIKFNAWNAFADQNGVYAVDIPYTIIHDGGWGKAMSFKLVNSLAAL
jgi:hypothetical protein